MFNIFFAVVCAGGTFVFLALCTKIFELKNTIENQKAEYRRLENFFQKRDFYYQQNLSLFQIGLQKHTKQMQEFADMLYYTEDNVPKYGKKLADLVLESKSNGVLYNYFLYIIDQHNLVEHNIYETLKKEYSLSEKDIIVCALLNLGFTSYQIWTVCNSTENAYYARCSRLRSKLKLDSSKSIPLFLDEYKKKHSVA